MLKILACAALIAVLYANSAGAQSREKTRQPVASQNTQPAAPDKRGTDQEPFAVKIIPSEPTKEDAEKAEKEKREQAKTEERLAVETQRVADYTWYLAFFTLALVGIAVTQAGLFIWQLRLIRRGADDTGRAADAAVTQAKISQETFDKIERPYLYIFGTRGPLIDAPGVAAWEGPFIQYSVANYGKTVAVIDEVWIQNCAEESGRPQNLLFTELTDELLWNRILAPNAEPRKVRNACCLMDWAFPDSGGAIPRLKETEEFFFCIEIRYHGPFTEGHVTKACWIWHQGEGALIEYNDKKYNCLT